MRCKKHYTDLSSTVGVCACCLRERLLSLIAAEEQTLAHVQNLAGKHRDSENIPAIQRSVSPYIHNRRRNHSDGAVVFSDNDRRTDVTEHHHLHHHHNNHSAASRHRHSLSDQLFDRTPEIGVSSGGDNTGIDSNKNRSFIRFVSFSNIFRSRNRKSVDSVSDLSESDSTLRRQCGGGDRTATSSPSWISSIVHGKRHRRKPPVLADESTLTAAGGDGDGDGSLRRVHCRDRGMSPVRNSDVDNGDVAEHESTESWKNTPGRTPARRGGGGGGGGGHRRNLSGLTFCLSPLVRASPNRRWNPNGMPPDGVFSGENRAPVKPHLSNTKSFHANRSRKLVDFGRCNHNR